MEILYFPLFLVVAAVLVIWLFSRARKDSRRRNSRDVKTPAGRTVNVDRLQRSTDRRGPAAGYHDRVGGKKANEMWRSRRKRASHNTYAVNDREGDRDVYYAGYMGPRTNFSTKHGNDGELKDQDVSQTEHIGIEEYLSKHERERAAAEAAAAKESALSMTAIKYEPSEDADSKEDKPASKQASFKP
jgi:hypothetical protein